MSGGMPPFALPVCLPACSLYGFDKKKLNYIAHACICALDSTDSAVLNRALKVWVQWQATLWLLLKEFDALS